MTTQEHQHACCTLIEKLTTGVRLDEAEKSHLAECEECMNQVVRALDEKAKKAYGNGSANGETNGRRVQTRPEARKALEHGRRVFEREFGIALRKE